MRLPVAGESAAHLPWLWPDAHSLAALTQPLSETTWTALRRDPAALLLQQRFNHSPSSFDEPESKFAPRFLEPRVLETVRDWYDCDRGHWLDWRNPSILPIYRTALAIAWHARLIAEAKRNCSADAAWTAGLLTPLGWFGIAAVDPVAAGSCRSDPSFFDDPIETERRHWGLDHTAIAARLARRWQLPDSLRTIICNLDLPMDRSGGLDERPLRSVIQLAVAMADHAGYSLGLVTSLDPTALLDSLELSVNELRQVQERFQEVDLAEAFELDWQDPRENSGIRDEICQTIEARRQAATPFLEPLERDVDCLHQTLRDWKQNTERRLQTAKLAALAEFAAGASHEINNPLAVISGQSQFLLQREIEEDFRPALESIVRQTQRINAILTELMQFARPPRLARQRLVLAAPLRAAVESLRGMADEAGVNLHCGGTTATLWVDADPRLLQTAVSCLVRNAIEAASLEKGWVRVRVEHTGENAEIVVEDSGPGPQPAHREHLFDPFFSGRSAGRGRGLGLPTAWRLAREHGGDVRFAPKRGGPTRFVLSLPTAQDSTTAIERMSA